MSTNRTNVLRDYGVEAGGAVLSDRLWLWGAWGKNQIDLQKLGQLDTEGRQVNENSTLENFDARLDAQLAASNSLELYYHHGDRIQDGRGVDINTAPESGFNLTQPVPIYKIADTQVFSSSLTATAFFSYMDFVQTATPVGGVDTPAVHRSERRAPRKQHCFANPFDRPAGRGLRLEVLHDREPVARAQVRIRVPRTRRPKPRRRCPGGQVYGDEHVGLAYITRGGGRDDAGSAARRLRERHADVRPPDGQRGRPLRRWSGAKRGRVRSRQPGLPGPPSGGPLPGRRGLSDLGREVAAARGRDLRARAESADPSARLVLPVRRPLSRRHRLREPLPRDAGPLLLLDGHEREPPSWIPDEVDLDSLAGFYNVDPANPGAASAPNQISPNLKPTTVDEFVVGADQELLAGLTASVHYTYRSIRAIVFSPYIGVTSGGGGYEYSGNATGSVTDPYGFGSHSTSRTSV